jgi:hypothetical protein
MVSVSQILVGLFGAMLCVFAGWGVVAPTKILDFTKRTMDAVGGIYLAVGMRVVMGLALLTVAPVSRFPTALYVIGWIALIAAVVAVCLGRRRLQAFIDWWIERFTPALVRVWIGLAFAFGAFLIYAVYAP